MQDLYQELSDFTKREYNIVRERCQTARVELAWLWEQYKDNPIEYYRDSDLYLFDLTMYQQVLRDAGFHKWFERVLKDFQIKTCLDYGGGIGEYTIIACNNGVKIDFLEVDDSKTLEYAKYRFRRYGVQPKILGLKDSIDKYDLIVCMDVLEHIKDNQPIMKNFAERCNYFICNTQEEMSYGWMYPQHISPININPYFEFIENHLWKSKT